MPYSQKFCTLVAGLGAHWSVHTNTLLANPGVPHLGLCSESPFLCLALKARPHLPPARRTALVPTSWHTRLSPSLFTLLPSTVERAPDPVLSGVDLHSLSLHDRVKPGTDIHVNKVNSGKHCEYSDQGDAGREGVRILHPTPKACTGSAAQKACLQTFICLLARPQWLSDSGVPSSGS